MTPQQKTLIRETWQMVTPIADQAASMFYERLFDLNPELRPLFPGAISTRHRQKLIAALSAVVEALEHLETIVPTLESLGRRHTSYGVEDAHYETVGTALLDTLEKGLGDNWSEDAGAAWGVAYGPVAGVMRNAAASQDPASMAAA